MVENSKTVAAFIIMYEDESYDLIKEGVMMHQIPFEDGYAIDVNFLNLMPDESLEMLKYVQDGLIRSMKHVKTARKAGLDSFQIEFKGE